MATRTNAFRVVVSAALVLLMLSPAASAQDAGAPKRPPTRQGARPPAQQSKMPTLDDASRAALLKAIEHEREGIDLYGAVIAKHCNIRPFAQILEAEKRHETDLINVAKRFALNVPAHAATKPNVPDTVKDACEAAVKWERDTGSLFNQLSADVKRPGIKNTLTRQASTATERHLPAFERCVKLGGALPQKAEAPPRCEGCDMVGCPCTHDKVSADGQAKSGAAAKPGACNCTPEKK